MRKKLSSKVVERLSALWAPKGTLKSVIGTLNTAVVDTLAEPERVNGLPISGKTAMPDINNGTRIDGAPEVGASPCAAAFYSRAWQARVSQGG